MRKHDLVIFDWNGTLQDDLHHIYECGVQRIFRHFGLACPTLEQYRHEVTADFMVFYRDHGVPADVTAQDLNAIMGEGFKEKGRPADLFPDAAPVVTALRGRGYPLALASGYDSSKLAAAVARGGLAQAFFRVDGDVRDKAATFASIIAEAGATPDRTAVIGDTVEDVLGASAVGATPYICTRGFHPVERIEATRGDAPSLVIVGSLDELLPRFP